MNGLVFSHNPIISTDKTVLEFGSVAQVGAYFGPDSEEYTASVTYFTGYTNKFTAPRKFFVARRVDEAVSGWMRTGPYLGTLAALKAVTDGAFGMTIDGTTQNITGVDLSAATSFSDVAAILTALDSLSATVTYSSLNRAFTVTSDLTGAGHDVSYATSPATGTDLATLLNATQALGAVTSSSSDAMSVNAQMIAIRKESENWVTFTTLWEPTIDEMLELSGWASANYGWMYVAYTTDPLTPIQDSEVDPASVLKASRNEYTAIVYGSIEYAMFIMGTVASIAWRRLNGTITLAFKRGPGLAPYVTDESQAQVLESKNCNYFGNFATRNAEFVFLYNSCLTNSIYGFIDPLINSIWLNNMLQRAIMDGLALAGRVPYNERGYTKIRSWMMDPIKAALNNAAIEPGISLSEAQKTELINEAGFDISGELDDHGYFIQILDPGADVRARRESPICNLWYTYASSVQRIELASTAVL
jgi:hypothetical protein